MYKMKLKEQKINSKIGISMKERKWKIEEDINQRRI